VIWQQKFKTKLKQHQQYHQSARKTHTITDTRSSIKGNNLTDKHPKIASSNKMIPIIEQITNDDIKHYNKQTEKYLEQTKC